jgi:hypothetical protein
MIVLTTQTTQNIGIIPIYQQDPINSGNAFMMEFTNETTKEVFTVQASSVAYIFDYVQLTSTALTFLKENTFYNLKVYFQNSNTITYKDRVICTNQSIDTFSINNGEYTLPNIDNNNYITI